MKTNVARFSVLALLILTAAGSRVIPHMPDFSPLGAIALFGAAQFGRKWQAFLVPIAATWLSDLFLNNYVYEKDTADFVWISSGFYWIYGSYLLITLAGIFILRKETVARIGAGVLCSTAIFFLVTNFACWLGSKNFPQDFGGLMSCYAVALPFLKGTIAGDFFYAVVLFGVFALAKKRFPELRRETNI